MRHPQRDRDAIEVKPAIETSPPSSARSLPHLFRPAGFWTGTSRPFGGDDAS
jgi:hypothetical protein